MASEGGIPIVIFRARRDTVFVISKAPRCHVACIARDCADYQIPFLPAQIRIWIPMVLYHVTCVSGVSIRLDGHYILCDTQQKSDDCVPSFVSRFIQKFIAAHICTSSFN